MPRRPGGTQGQSGSAPACRLAASKTLPITACLGRHWACTWGGGGRAILAGHGIQKDPSPLTGTVAPQADEEEPTMAADPWEYRGLIKPALARRAAPRGRAVSLCIMAASPLRRDLVWGSEARGKTNIFPIHLKARGHKATSDMIFQGKHTSFTSDRSNPVPLRREVIDESEALSPRLCGTAPEGDTMAAGLGHCATPGGRQLCPPSLATRKNPLPNGLVFHMNRESGAT